MRTIHFCLASAMTKSCCNFFFVILSIGAFSITSLASPIIVSNNFEQKKSSSEIPESNIYNGDIFLYSQKAINNFSSRITVIKGDLHISGLAINDLSPLSNLEIVKGNVIISNTSLIYLDDLKSLKTIELDLDLSNNSKLEISEGFKKQIQILGEFMMDESIGQAPIVMDIQVFPNPATNILHIYLSDSMIKGIIQLTDVLGREIMAIPTKESLLKYTFQVERLERGNYWVCLITEGHKITKKVILK